MVGLKIDQCNRCSALWQANQTRRNNTSKVIVMKMRFNHFTTPVFRTQETTLAFLQYHRISKGSVLQEWNQNQMMFVEHQSNSTSTIPIGKLNGGLQVGKVSRANSWDVITLCHEGRLKEALYLMDQVCIRVHPHAYASLLQACIDIRGLTEGKRVHAHMLKHQFVPDTFLGTKLLIMYAKCGSLMNARLVFDEMPERNVISWNVMITGYTRSGRIEDARQLFDQMPERDVASWNAMIAGYTQNGRVEDGRQLFDEMPERDVVSWNAMIAGYAQNEHGEEALTLYCQMQLAGVMPTQSTFTSIINACISLEAVELGKKTHGGIIKRGFMSDVFVQNVLITLYARIGSVDNARQVFDKMFPRDIISWNALIAGYAQSSRVDDARQLFDRMSERNVVTWNAMIAGYAQNESAEEALKLFFKMQRTLMKPDQSTFTSFLNACATLAALQQGKQCHGHIITLGFKPDVFLRNALVTMYAKCGSIDDAWQEFEQMPIRNVVSWNAMITGYAQHGCGNEALQLFEQMCLTGMKPNGITFVGVLCACCHAGLVDEGWHYFDSMHRDHCITPAADHYACLVDLLGRAGRLYEAVDCIDKMPFEPDAVVWGALLGACRVHGNMELGQRAAEHLFELEPQNSTTYVLLSNIYAAVGRWDDVVKVRTMMKERGVAKKPGCSWIEIKNRVHAFLVGDTSHPQTEKIYARLEKLTQQMKEAGYVPEKNFVLLDVEEEQKESILFYHSEKLAIAFGLINTPPGTPIRIIKNLRVCGDCHTVTKLISKIVGREIVLRDTNRFHHFKDGLCSCGDYW